MKKLTKKDEKEAIKNIGNIISTTTSMLRKAEDDFIKEMIEMMTNQSELICKARYKGVDIEKAMIKLKNEYTKK